MTKGAISDFWCFLPASHAPYKWDYWPHDDVRAECRFVGLTNLGATCYMASTIQQLYMIPEARQAVFTAKVRTHRSDGKRTGSETVQFLTEFI